MARLTRKAFEAWLEKQPKGRVFRGCATSCPLACFYRENGSPGAWVFDVTVDLRGDGDRPLPRWASAFSKENVGGTLITAASALKLLRSIP